MEDKIIFSAKKGPSSPKSDSSNTHVEQRVWYEHGDLTNKRKNSKYVDGIFHQDPHRTRFYAVSIVENREFIYLFRE